MLKNEIEKSGETQSRWAEMLGVSRAYLSNILSGKRQPSLELACKIETITEGRVPAGSWFLGAAAVATDCSVPAKDAAA